MEAEAEACTLNKDAGSGNGYIFVEAEAKNILLLPHPWFKVTAGCHKSSRNYFI